ncbi:hypothetical protein [Hydrogenophaga sp. BPS33]|uniref:hypothetical protein n=1 Tax=Hydrogenophaga sp. BPS33 TaxID=2651974 RepID=UPI00131F4EF2|nr:hypothetical protein [Hydrogenophaga sp. BPS33]QHE86410.1 hypothetical protein F9K07_16625 [Hydrogenophaga sp. BPS33]
MSNEEITIAEAPTLDDLVQVLREGQCPSVSGRSVLTYHLGHIGEREHFIRIHDNTGRGMFARDWIFAKEIDGVIAGDGPITSSAFRELYAGRSINTGGFLMAVLLGLGVLVPMPEGARGYARNPDVPLASVFTPTTEAPKRKSRGAQ